MQPVRLDHAGEIAFFGPEPEIDAPVDQDVVKQKIDEAVTENADARRERRRRAINADINENDRRNGEKHREPVVPFKGAVSRFMMRFVQRPQKSVHGVTMGEPGDAFHDENEGDNDDDEKERRHVAHLIRILAPPRRGEKRAAGLARPPLHRGRFRFLFNRRDAEFLADLAGERGE